MIGSNATQQTDMLTCPAMPIAVLAIGACAKVEHVTAIDAEDGARSQARDESDRMAAIFEAPPG